MALKTAVQASTPAEPSRRTSSRFGGAAGLLLLSIAFHLVYLGSIFDIYFKSPVTRGVGTRYGAEPEGGAAVGEQREALAKRVVLIVGERATGQLGCGGSPRSLAHASFFATGDGLRADKLFQTYPSPPFAASQPLPAPLTGQPHAFAAMEHGLSDQTTPAPFIRGLIQSGQAEWGVSHTRVPTESRPGHVALIGGMYEVRASCF